MEDKCKRYPKNAPGDFYVEDGMCLICMTPHSYAPELMGMDENADVGAINCYFTRQPQTDEEVTHAILAVWSSCVECLRYNGNDSQILQRLVNLGRASKCDQLPANAIPKYRNHVSFEASFASEVQDLANAFEQHLSDMNKIYDRYRVLLVAIENNAARIVYTWVSDELAKTMSTHKGFYQRPEMEFHIQCGESNTKRWLIHHSWEDNGRSIAIDEWLRADPRIREIRWFTPEDWRNSTGQWQELPY